jgi:predicted negative regulator of RcsB-dependent stress response
MKDISKLKEKLFQYLSVARKNAPLIFVVFLLAVYGFLAWRITQLIQTEPSPSDVSAKLQTGVPKVDPTVIQKIEDLKDSNVNVQTIFDNARNNPFQE